MIKQLGIGMAALSAAILISGSAGAAAFPNKNITFIIPYGPGGGFDTYVRKVAPLMEKYLPNKVNVLPKNVTGAGGRKAIADLARAKPNGYTIAIFNMPGMLLDKILGKKSRFDIEKFTWLGVIARSPYTLSISTKSKYNSIEDLIKAKKTLKYAVTSPSSTSYVAGKILAATLGLKVKFLTGYKGSAKISLSVIRGDTDMSLFSTRQYIKYAKGGDLKAVLSIEKKSPLAGIPTVGDIGFPGLASLATERVVGTVPNTPKAIAKVLETALYKAITDPVMTAWAKKGRRPLAPQTAAQTQARVKELITFYSKYKSVLAAK
jgi:tripartite-type tricarboxylate transporter receptor subunit TctC